MIKLTKEEMETIISYDELTRDCQIYTCSPSLKPKLESYCKLYPDTYKLKSKDEYSITVMTTKNFITIRTGKKRVMTDEQKLASSERMKKMQDKRQPTIKS